MKRLITILYLILICLYFANLIINHDYSFNFYFVGILVISGFLTISNFSQKNEDKPINLIKYKAFNTFSIISYFSILLCIILFFTTDEINNKYSIVFFIYSLNLFIFIFVGVKFRDSNLINP